MKTLAEYAKANRVPARTAWNAYKAGKIPRAYKNEFGKILGPEREDVQTRKQDDVVCYARVSSSMNKEKLASQAQGLSDDCRAKG